MASAEGADKITAEAALVQADEEAERATKAQDEADEAYTSLQQRRCEMYQRRLAHQRANSRMSSGRGDTNTQRPRRYAMLVRREHTAADILGPTKSNIPLLSYDSTLDS